jgi:hypothetical protein
MFTRLDAAMVKQGRGSIARRGQLDPEQAHHIRERRANGVTHRLPGACSKGNAFSR